MAETKRCGQCSHIVEFPHLPDKPKEEITLMCTNKRSGYYKVCANTYACDMHQPTQKDAHRGAQER